MRSKLSAIRNYLDSKKIDGAALVTHRFSLDDFNKAVATQANPAAGSLKIIVEP
jgi:threonine dehydrogenase-like Zn-dependent dehydrogenase